MILETNSRFRKTVRGLFVCLFVFCLFVVVVVVLGGLCVTVHCCSFKSQDFKITLLCHPRNYTCGKLNVYLNNINKHHIAKSVKMHNKNVNRGMGGGGSGRGGGEAQNRRLLHNR